MSISSVWDDPELKAGGEFVSFEKPGDSVSGVITTIRTHRFDDGKVVPQILIKTDEGEDRTATCGQVRLKAELAALRPNPGDHIKITFTEEEKRQGGKTLKHFQVLVNAGGEAVPAASPAPAAAAAVETPAGAPAIDPAAAAAALANLSPEQKAALGI